MVQTCANLAPMNAESSWDRLYRLVEARREHLGLSRNAVKARGGPSSEWIRQLVERDGRPSVRNKAPLNALDKALGWTEGTSWGLLTEDRSAWQGDVLEDEENVLVFGDVFRDIDVRIRDFQTIVGAKLMNMTAEDAQAAMVDISRRLGII